MKKKFLKLYAENSPADSAFLLNNGHIFLYASPYDKYSINGNNLIVGATELILNHFGGMQTGRIETAVSDSESSIKKIPAPKFIESMESFSFLINACMVLAKQVLLTNGIININMKNLSDDDHKNRGISVEYFKIIEKIKNEYAKRKLPWLKELLHKYETSIIYKKGEAFYRASEPVKVEEISVISENQIEYPRGSIICEENTEGQEMFILQSGIIDVYIGGGQVASISEPGTVSGEMALLLNEKRTATLKAKNDVILMKISKDDLKKISLKDNSILKTVSVSLAKRHFYNIVKINSINMLILEKNSDADKKEGAGRDLEKNAKELSSLKQALEDVCRKKDADFLKELVKTF